MSTSMITGAVIRAQIEHRVSRGDVVLRTATSHAVPDHRCVGSIAIQNEGKVDVFGVGVVCDSARTARVPDPMTNSPSSV